MKQRRYSRDTIGMRWRSIFFRRRRSAAGSGVDGGRKSPSTMLRRVSSTSWADAMGVELSTFSVVAFMMGQCQNFDIRKRKTNAFFTRGVGWTLTGYKFRWAVVFVYLTASATSESSETCKTSPRQVHHRGAQYQHSLCRSSSYPCPPIAPIPRPAPWSLGGSLPRPFILREDKSCCSIFRLD